MSIIQDVTDLNDAIDKYFKSQFKNTGAILKCYSCIPTSAYFVRTSTNPYSTDSLLFMIMEPTLETSVNFFKDKNGDIDTSILKTSAFLNDPGLKMLLHYDLQAQNGHIIHSADFRLGHYGISTLVQVINTFTQATQSGNMPSSSNWSLSRGFSYGSGGSNGPSLVVNGRSARVVAATDDGSVQTSLPGFNNEGTDLHGLSAENQTERWKKEGRCPQCGELGRFVNFCMTCSIHGVY